MLVVEKIESLKKNAQKIAGEKEQKEKFRQINKYQDRDINPTI